MRYLIEPNEMMGFIELLNAGQYYARSTPDGQKADGIITWTKAHPELNATSFKDLTTFINLYDQRARAKGEASFTTALKNNILNIHSLSDLKNTILDAYPQEGKRLCSMIDTIYPFYHKFYDQNVKKQSLTKCAGQLTQAMNASPALSIEQVAQFYSYQIPADHTAIMYIYPSENPYGTNFSTPYGSIQAAGLRTDRPFNPPRSFIFHEKVHGIFEESGQHAWLHKYLTADNPIVRAMSRYPELKQTEVLDSAQAARQTINEALTTAFQGIYEERLQQETGLPLKIRDNLYETQPAINTMAHRLIPLLKDALKTGETFGSAFMKKVEKEFMSVVDNPALMQEIRAKQTRAPMRKETSISKLISTLLKPLGNRSTTAQVSPSVQSRNNPGK